MKVALFGGTGYVGSHLIDALLASDNQPVPLVRAGSEGRVRQRERCAVVTGDIADRAAIEQAVSAADAVIYNIGILREFPARGVTFDELHAAAVGRVVEACERLGVRRFLLMSANGVDSEGTAYQRSKLAGERRLAASTLDWTVFRPSVIFGDPRGRMEFATQLLRDVVLTPLPAPLFYGGLLPFSAGTFKMSPVHVGDVARAFTTALHWPTTIGQVLPLGGPRELTWREILDTIAAAVGRRKLMLPVPALGVSTAAMLLDRFESFPVTRDQLRMLLEGNTCDSEALLRFDIQPTAFDVDSLAYLKTIAEEDEGCHRNAA